jgi:hypothetical protein
LANILSDALFTYSLVNNVLGVMGSSSIGYGLHNSSLGSLVQAVQLIHILLVELETVDVGVANDARRRVALRKRNVALLQTPPDENLVWLLVVLLGDAGERLVVRFLVAYDRAVSFDDDVLGFAVFDDFALLAPGVELTQLLV